MLEYLFLADDRVCIIIYSRNNVRSAVVITLPFITCVQRQYVEQDDRPLGTNCYVA